MKLLLRSSFNRVTGYGNDAIDIARMMMREGVDLRVFPVYFLPPVPEDFVHVLTLPLDKKGYDATLQFLPPFDIAVRDTQGMNRRRNGLPTGMAKLHYAWSMWEQSLLVPEDMKGHGLGSYPWRRLRAMYVTWDGCVDAFANYDPKIEYRVMPCGVDGDLYEVHRRPTTGPTKFCMIGELGRRKDPFVAVEAFGELLAEHGEKFNAELHLKTMSPGLHPAMEEWMPGVKVHKGIWPYEQLLAWMNDMTCYVGPSRGEGNLKPPMEFMASGGTVIVTNWSGPRNWLNPDCTYPLDYVLRPVHKGKGDGSMEARASKAHLKELMWHVHTHRREVSARGLKAAEWIRQVADWQTIVRKLLEQIEADLRYAA